MIHKHINDREALSQRALKKHRPELRSWPCYSPAIQFWASDILWASWKMKAITLHMSVAMRTKWDAVCKSTEAGAWQDIHISLYSVPLQCRASVLRRSIATGVHRVKDPVSSLLSLETEKQRIYSHLSTPYNLSLPTTVMKLVQAISLLLLPNSYQGSFGFIFPLD